MNRRGNILLVSTMAAILLLMWLLRPKASVPRAEQIEPTNNVVQATREALGKATHSNVESVGASPFQAPARGAPSEQLKREMENEISMWQAPILYFGKVVDENDAPISGAQAAYSASSLNTSLVEVENTGTVKTDERGIFKIEGVKGIGLMVQVTHPDYYPYPTNSTGFDKRSVPRKGYFSNIEEQAELFRMHHKGNPVALVKHGGGLHGPADGTTTMDVQLRGLSRKEILGHLLVQGWKDNPKKGERSNWGVKISVPNGGIVEFTDDFSFVAPKTGYQTTWQVAFSKDDPNWQSQTSRKFFIKLQNYYIRAGTHIDIYHDLYFSMDYVINPDGSANLEPDPQRPYFESAE